MELMRPVVFDADSSATDAVQSGRPERPAESCGHGCVPAVQFTVRLGEYQRKSLKKRLPWRNRGVSARQRFRELRRDFQGWVGCVRLVPIKTYSADLDKWIRRRIRSCYMLQWRRPRTRIAHLRKLGIRQEEAVTHGWSSKGPSTLSSSQCVNEALSRDYLAHEGLPSL